MRENGITLSNRKFSGANRIAQLSKINLPLTRLYLNIHLARGNVWKTRIKHETEKTPRGRGRKEVTMFSMNDIRLPSLENAAKELGFYYEPTTRDLGFQYEPFYEPPCLVNSEGDIIEDNWLERAIEKYTKSK